MSVAPWLSALPPLGPASIAALLLVVVYRMVVIGLQTIGQIGLPQVDRRLVARTLLIIICTVMMLGGVLVFLHQRAAASPVAPQDATTALKAP